MNSALLLSGGIDSTAIAFWRRPSIAVTVDYGQLSASAEIEAASQIARVLEITHRIVRLDARSLGAGDLAGRPSSPLNSFSEWWPFRNQLLVTVAAMCVAQDDIQTIAIGTVSTDDRHKDGSPAFIHALSRTLELQEGGLILSAPAADLTTVELVRTSEVPRELLAWSYSCHRGDLPCLECSGCKKYVGVMKDLADTN